MVQSLKPVGFKLRDFKMRSVQTSNYLQYDQVGCTINPKPQRQI